MSKGLVKVETTALGTIRVDEGEMQRGNVRLVAVERKLQAGIHYTIMPPYKGKGKLMISPDGADNCNAVAGLHVCCPPPQKEDIRDDKGFQEVTRRVVVLGCTPTGAMQIIDYSCTFNVRAYFEKDLFGKMKHNGEAIQMGRESDKPDGDGRWHWLELDDGMGIWMNVAHPEVIKVWETRSQNRQFADRRCMAVARRNALCQHGAMPQKMIGEYRGRMDEAPQTFKVQAFYFRPEDEMKLAAAANQIAAGVDPSEIKDAKYIEASHNVGVDDLQGIDDDDPTPEMEENPDMGHVGDPELPDFD